LWEARRPMRASDYSMERYKFPYQFEGDTGLVLPEDTRPGFGDLVSFRVVGGIENESDGCRA